MPKISSPLNPPKFPPPPSQGNNFKLKFVLRRDSYFLGTPLPEKFEFLELSPFQFPTMLRTFTRIQLLYPLQFSKGPTHLPTPTHPKTDSMILIAGLKNLPKSRRLLLIIETFQLILSFGPQESFERAEHVGSWNRHAEFN